MSATPVTLPQAAIDTGLLCVIVTFTERRAVLLTSGARWPARADLIAMYGKFVNAVKISRKAVLYILAHTAFGIQ